MKKNTSRNGIVIALATMMAMTAMTGCGKGVSGEVAGTAENSVVEETVADENVPLAAENEESSEVATDSYFLKGVYANYAKEAENPPKTNFYVFSEDTYGYTADGENNDIGLPFSIEQGDWKVDFYFGGADESKETLIVTGVSDGTVYGYFEDIPERELVFEPVEDADPNGFSAVNYLSSKTGGDFVFRDANGWNVKYDPSVITVNVDGPLTTFVYTGDCAGTCMITAEYGVDMDAEAKANDLAKSWGDEATVTECTFPGTEDVKGFYVDATPGQTGAGLYESAYIRDYMGGYLVFDLTQHVSGDDEIDIPVSDSLSAIIDTLKFEFE